MCCGTVRMFPKHERKRTHPRTPDKYEVTSKRGWEARIKQWRMDLHQFDPPEGEEGGEGEEKLSASEIANLVDIDGT